MAESNNIYNISNISTAPTLIQCYCCKELKKPEEMRKGKNKPCKLCAQQKEKELRQRHKEKFKISPVVKPEKHKCYKCKEYLNGKFFSLDKCRPSGIGNICKYHSTIEQLEKRKKSLSITRDQFFKLLYEPCTYCGSKENIGVDRSNNDIGYTYENCVACCSTCNYMKGELNMNDFLNHVKKIRAHHRKTTILQLLDELNICQG